MNSTTSRKEMVRKHKLIAPYLPKSQHKSIKNLNTCHPEVNAIEGISVLSFKNHIYSAANKKKLQTVVLGVGS